MSGTVKDATEQAPTIGITRVVNLGLFQWWWESAVYTPAALQYTWSACGSELTEARAQRAANRAWRLCPVVSASTKPPH